MKPGYKQTEAGVIPDEWDVTSLDSIASVTSGKRLPMGYFVGDTVTPYPYIRVTDMRPGWVDTSDVKYVPVEAYPSIRKYRIFQEDLFISVAGSLGIVGRIPAELDGANLTENANRISAIACDGDYLLHVMMSPIVQDVIGTEQTVGAQPKLALARIRKFSIPLPPTKEEQGAVAGALSDADALLAGLDRLIVKKRNVRRAAMQQLLTGNTRLPGFSGNWGRKRLGEIGKCLRGVSYRGDADLLPHDTEDTRRLLRSNNIKDSVVVTSDVQFVKSECVADRQLLKKGDILVCMANGSKALVGKSGFFNISDGFDYTFGAFMGAFRVAGDLASDSFTFYLFQTEKYRHYIANLLAGSSINNLAPSSIESLEFDFPSIEEQAAIAEVLVAMDAELEKLEARRENARLLKQGMMQELLTGKTRLVAA